MRCFMILLRSRGQSAFFHGDTLQSRRLENIAAISHSASQSLARVCSERVRSHSQLQKNQRLGLSRKKHGGPLIGELRQLMNLVSVFAQVSDIDGPANLVARSPADR